MRANRAFELLVTRGGLGPAFLAGSERLDLIELVSLDDGEVILFWEMPARAAARRLRALRRDLAGLSDEEFLTRWSNRSPGRA